MRCVSCSGTWRAYPTAAEAPLDLLPQATPEPEAAKPPPSLPKAIRAEREARQRTRKAVAAGAVWGMLAAALVAVVGGAALFRVEVVRLWPRTAGAYAKVGLAVNPTGLAPENILAGPGLKNGHAAIIVSGVVRNIETRYHDPVPLRIALLDKAGKPLVRQVVMLPQGRLQPGQTRPFSAAFLDPPTDSANVQVEFAMDVAAPQPARLAQAQGAATKLRGAAEPAPLPAPAPREAQPLPASSPYALPGAAQSNTRPAHEG